MPQDSKLDLPALGMLLLSGLGILAFLSAAAGLVLAGLVSMAAGGLLGGQSLPFFSLAWASLFFLLLLIPSLVNALIQLGVVRRPLWGIPHHLRLATLLLLFFPLLVLAGDFLSLQSQLAWALLPPLQILVTVIPVLWIFEVGRRGLSLSGARRGWGMVSFNLLVSQPFILAAELVLILFLGLLALLWLAGRPELVAELQRLAQRITDAGMDPALLQHILLPYLQQPLVILAILVVAAGLVPLLEELFKPLAVWGLVKRPLDPVDGFVGGMLCGATFTLVETLGNLANPVEMWAVVVVSRFGTALLHITASGLVGWGLASALSEGRYARLGAAYLVSAGLHAIWNVFGLLLGIAPLIEGTAPSAFVRLAQRLGMIAPAALAILMVVLFLILTGSNRRLRKTTPPGSPPAALPVQAADGPALPVPEAGESP